MPFIGDNSNNAYTNGGSGRNTIIEYTDTGTGGNSNSNEPKTATTSSTNTTSSSNAYNTNTSNDVNHIWNKNDISTDLSTPYNIAENKPTINYGSNNPYLYAFTAYTTPIRIQKLEEEKNKQKDKAADNEKIANDYKRSADRIKEEIENYKNIRNKFKEIYEKLNDAKADFKNGGMIIGDDYYLKEELDKCSSLSSSVGHDIRILIEELDDEYTNQNNLYSSYKAAYEDCMKNVNYIQEVQYKLLSEGGSNNG